MKYFLTILTLFVAGSAFAVNWVPIDTGELLFFIPVDEESPQSRATIPGIDADQDGVRDDVLIKINKQYKNDEYARTQSIQMAIKYQQLLAQTLNYTQVIARLGEIETIESCLKKNRGSILAGKDFMLPVQFNTYQRSKQFLTLARDAVYQIGEPNYVPCN